MPPRRLTRPISSACLSRSAEIEPGENRTEKRLTVLGNGARFDCSDKVPNRMRCIPKTTDGSVSL